MSDGDDPCIGRPDDVPLSEFVEELRGKAPTPAGAAPRDEARPKTRGDIGYFAAEAYDAAVQAFEATRFGYEMRPDSELWSRAYDALTKACDALAAIRRST